ncbi:restriction endonuclease subunit S [Labilibaculum sp. A4]|uniref:restriction endonuclease subunit S n=1 Tax=Labilibaculum euxinus TaxID=2686357 RepID=UPI000F626372|nr:restriction endonuclease subunit S [Labilibaculum euxinus]MDQ1770218.1 restriction endonuclease subunit S [Labilibaculum euxinus]MWN77568.1 restriction endonuclease subunit S [Labilibaculum euxinus]
MSRVESLVDVTVKIGSGATPRGGNKAYKTEGISLIRSQNVHDFKFLKKGLAFIDNDQAELLNNVTVQENDILLNITGDSIARACMVPEEILPARVNQHVAIIRCEDKKDAYYVLCYLQFLKKHLLTICKVGGTRNALTKEAIQKLLISFVENHRKKANLIDLINSKIELNNRINTELESMAKLLYDYWFVQFDFPDENGKPYKSSGGKMVFNQDLKREIPVGWEVGFLGSILKTSLGGTPSTKNKQYWENGEFQWLNSGEIANFPIITSELKITKDAIINSATKLMPKGTVTLSITRHIRPSILAIDACANQSVVGVYETEKIKSSYSYPLICNEVPKYMSLRTGAQQPHINKQTVDKTLMILPSKEILDKYYELANPTYEKININAFQNKELVGLRDWLLPMLMNGQVTVKEAEAKLSNLAMVAEPAGEYKTNQ